MDLKTNVVNIQKNKKIRRSKKDKIVISDLNFYYGKKKVLENISFPVRKNSITSIIGPSGCGKTTLLRAINRLHDEIKEAKITGEIYLDGKNILTEETDVTHLRTKVGLVFQKPNPFPGTIYNNVVFGPRLFGIRNKSQLDEICERSLKQAALWKEVKNKLHDKATRLSGGQQQRLCIARTLAMEPEVILMDEPASALDPISTLKIEDLMAELKEKYTLIVVTHNMQQAARISDYVAFMFAGEDLIAHLIEYGRARKIFVNPEVPLTEKYIAGRLG